MWKAFEMHFYHEGNPRNPALKQGPNPQRTSGRAGKGPVCTDSMARDGRAYSQPGPVTCPNVADQHTDSAPSMTVLFRPQPSTVPRPLSPRRPKKLWQMPAQLHQLTRHFQDASGCFQSQVGLVVPKGIRPSFPELSSM